MARISLNELYYGDRYNVMGEVLKRMLLSSDRSIDEQAKFELEIVRQTIIAIKKMKENGDSIAEEELGDGVALSLLGGRNDNT